MVPSPFSTLRGARAGAPTSLRARAVQAVGLRFGLVRRAMTLGVRAAVFDAGGRVFLVRHTYTPGWYLPGGGVEPGESALAALARELREECEMSLDAPPDLFGLYLNRAGRARDHVALYVVRDFRQPRPKARDFEIAEAGFFAPDAPPAGLTPATRARLAEIAGLQPIDPFW